MPSIDMKEGSTSTHLVNLPLLSWASGGESLYPDRGSSDPITYLSWRAWVPLHSTFCDRGMVKKQVSPPWERNTLYASIYPFSALFIPSPSLQSYFSPIRNIEVDLCIFGTGLF